MAPLKGTGDDTLVCLLHVEFICLRQLPCNQDRYFVGLGFYDDAIDRKSVV